MTESLNNPLLNEDFIGILFCFVIIILGTKLIRIMIVKVLRQNAVQNKIVFKGLIVTLEDLTEQLDT
ncbi:CLUMA_CG011745, isoform A [Clunio marinus]|uniref:CLUMA_CG011745, isoform A n=1 Tax=Clunio marinus TaxID=568069 RepID=A0A1J1IF51_9DIPT|nr:CLUMA_CG011745, isoform A [Clunio marinus]